MMMNSGLKEKIYKNSLDCYQQIVQKEGFKAFFKGNMTNTVRSFGSSVVLVLYDEIEKFYNKKRF
jgi:solute carrier family 25 (adenine nucleotide translocator) protein 4/5/6/31